MPPAAAAPAQTFEPGPAAPTPPLPAAAQAAQQPHLLRVLYVFAGQERKADINFYLRSTENLQLEISEIDVLRDPRAHDVTRQGVWSGIMESLAAGEWDVLVITPPCNTWSRLPWSSSPGPKPLRSRRHPWGFPWLTGPALAKCTLGNSFVKQTFEAVLAAHGAGTKFLVEHPEDLGLTSAGGEPASIWMLEELLAIHTSTGAQTAALFQCSFGADYGKPTRLWSTLPQLAELPHAGWPRFDAKGHYRGPLPAV